jgi:hypothetical protein
MSRVLRVKLAACFDGNVATAWDSYRPETWVRRPRSGRSLSSGGRRGAGYRLGDDPQLRAELDRQRGGRALSPRRSSARPPVCTSRATIAVHERDRPRPSRPALRIATSEPAGGRARLHVAWSAQHPWPGPLDRTIASCSAWRRSWAVESVRLHVQSERCRRRSELSEGPRPAPDRGREEFFAGLEVARAACVGP